MKLDMAIVTKVGLFICIKQIIDQNQPKLEKYKMYFIFKLKDDMKSRL